MTIATIKPEIPSAPFEGFERGVVLTYSNPHGVGGLVCRNKSATHRHVGKGVSVNNTKVRVVSRHFAGSVREYVVESPNGCRWKVSEGELT